MTRTWMRRALCTAAAVPLVLGLAACGGSSDSDSENEAAASDTCATLPSADPAATLPTGYPALSGQVLYEPSKQGSTTIVFGRVEESGFLAVRDELVDKLKSAGYKIEGTDQESVEAEAEFSGPQNGTIKVQPLCKGNVSIRYKFES